MEELFQYMKTFRSQVNDVADKAAETTLEEHLQCSTIENLQVDLDSVRSETRQVKEEIDNMDRQKKDICSQILEKQRKLVSMESDSSTLNETLKLMQQEKLSSSLKLTEKSAYYKMVEEDLIRQLEVQQEWVNSQNTSSRNEEAMICDKPSGPEELQDNQSEILMMQVNAAKTKLDQIVQSKSNLLLENDKLRQSVEQVKARINNFKPELRAMDEKSMEIEIQDLSADKAGETEYVQSLQLQIMKLKEIAQTVNCPCGEEYLVKLGDCD